MDSTRIMAVRIEGKNVSETPEWINSEDVLSTRSERIKGNDKFIMTTIDGEYYYCTSIDHITTLLSQLSGFEISDRGTVANLNYEVNINKERRILIFNKFPEIFATIAGTKMAYIKKCVEKMMSSK